MTIDYMSFLKRITDPMVRGLGDLLWTNYFKGSSWLDKSYWGPDNVHPGNTEHTVGDTKVSPSLLVEVCRSQVVYAIKKTIRDRLKEKPYYFKGGKNTSKQLLETLQEADYDRFVDNWFEAMLGSGGGNCLVFVSDGKLICEPFFAEGKERVKVVADYDRREISEYLVYNGAGALLTRYSPDEVIHERYSDEGDFRFGINPAVVSLRYYGIAKKAFGALENGFDNIINAKRFVSPDYSFLKDINVMDRDTIMIKWQEFRGVLSSLAGFMASPLPMKFDNMTLTPQEMQTKDILMYLDVVMGGAYSTSLSIIGRTDGVNYANGQQNADNFYELAVETIKARIESVTMRLMQELVPAYDPFSTPFKFCREYNEEDLKLRDQVLTTLTDVAPAITSLGYRIKKESIANLLSKFGLELEDGVEVIDVQAKEDVDQTGDEDPQTGRFFQRAITKSQIKGIEYLEKDKEVQEAKKKVYRAIERQINESNFDWDDNDSTKRDLDTQEKTIKKLQSYLNEDGFNKVNKKIIESAVWVYNHNQGTDYTIKNAPDHLIKYAELFAKVTVHGWGGVDNLDQYSKEVQEMVKIPRDYEGVDATTTKELKRIESEKKVAKEMPDEARPNIPTKQEFIGRRQEAIWRGIEDNVFNAAQDEFAKADGMTFFGVVTTRDDRVRDKHRRLDNKYGPVGQMPDPKNDEGCRCAKFYSTDEQELINMGFSRYTG